MQEIPFLEQQFLGSAVSQWGYALAVAIMSVVGLRAVMRLGVRWARRYASRTQNDIDDLIIDLLERTKLVFVLLLAVWGGSRVLTLPGSFDRWIRAFLVLGFLVQGGVWASAGVRYVLKRYQERQLETDPGGALAVGIMSFTARAAVWSLVLLLALENLGVDITALVTTLGIGGIAVALAVQNVLGDLLGSLSIALDKPFVIGDSILVGDFSGTVERVGIKTTRIRSISGEQMIFANSDLLSSRIRNFRRMDERRIAFSLGVTYDTPPDQLERIPGIVRSSVESLANARFDRCHFKSLGDFSLSFEIVYFVTVPDYPAYMDAQQAINLQLMRRFAEEGIEFAFPTQTLHVLQRGEPGPERPQA